MNTADNFVLPRFFNLQLWSEVSCEPRGLSSLHPEEGIVCGLDPGLLKIVCMGDSWSPVISNYIGVLICSVSLADEIQEAGLSVGARYPVAIVDAQEGIRKKPSPEYVYFQCRRGLFLESASTVNSNEAGRPERLIPCPETWDGSDLFGVWKKGSVALYVSRKFVLTAHKKGWTSFMFRALDLPYTWRHENIIRIGREAWPPLWYPEGVQPDPANAGPMPAVRREDGIREKAEGDSVAWNPPSDDYDEDDFTGHQLLGESVRWGFSGVGLDPDEADAVEQVKSFIAQYLDAALKVAGGYMQELAEEYKYDKKLEIWSAEITISNDSPEDGSFLLWELHVSASYAGPCPSHFLTFRGAELVDTSAAD